MEKELKAFLPSETDPYDLGQCTLMIDEFMRIVMKNNKPLAAHMIEVVLGLKDFTIVKLVLQDQEKAELNYSYVLFDLFVRLNDGTLVDIEFQNEKTSDFNERLRAYQSTLDLRQMKKKKKRAKDYRDKIKDSYIIFFTRTSFFQDDAPLVKIGHYDFTHHREIDLGNYIYIINTQYQDPSTSLGRLNHDLRCSNIHDMLDRQVKESLLEFRHKGGAKNMSDEVKALMDLAKSEGRAEGRKEGRKEGKAEGRAEGKAEGRKEGKAEGKAEGRAEGKAEGTQETKISNAVSLIQNDVSEETVIKSLHLTPSDIEIVHQRLQANA